MKKFADWSKAPAEAKWHTVDKNGLGCWWQTLPTPEYHVWFSKNSDPTLSETVCLGDVAWDDTLEVRPAETSKDYGREPATNPPLMSPVKPARDDVMVLTPTRFLLHESNSPPWNKDAIDVQLQDEGDCVFLVLRATDSANGGVKLTPRQIECLANNLPTMLAKFNRGEL